jgi:hypothetical protein
MDWRGAPKGAPSLYAALVSVISGRIACRTSSETVVSRRCAAAFSDCRSAGLRHGSGKTARSECIGTVQTALGHLCVAVALLQLLQALQQKVSA